MALQLCLRATFIDVVDTSTAMAMQQRSVSAPATTRRRIMDFTIEAQEDLQMSGYLSSLPARAEQLLVLCRREAPTLAVDAKNSKAASAVETASTASPNETAVSSEQAFTAMEGVASLAGPSRQETPPALEEIMPSPGSLGHPEVCRRPCIFFAAGSCANGSSCGYCHMAHTERPHHLDKRQREIMQNLSQAELLYMILKSLRLRAAATNLLSEASEVIEIMEHWAAEQPAAQYTANKAIQKLDTTLSKLPFSSLISMACRSSQVKNGSLSQHYCHELTQAMNKMRCRMADSLLTMQVDQ
eukprot:TRINITY_DN1066_c0_g1_i1.p1 TRINITY_DN1066_c0_g1~~TRINITY_DN1066_c0_g1_i1.p1  ORF type:complete len:300 (-),score=67.65 TRINITY_DN1066_c0_g1_i1:54-953(-)